MDCGTQEEVSYCVASRGKSTEDGRSYSTWAVAATRLPLSEQETVLDASYKNLIQTALLPRPDDENLDVMPTRVEQKRKG